ncbi:uncharacterized protein NPIL_600371 [Nephila pilipes]|uniref:Uncharacterized protein n=1 Tax=Nephila pilipes TaxID=299642 RepID=A0A8X6TTY0_NEPPI|nr:uncharacterized protein NPIL_600371 [Nephila pilipes]
MQLKEKQEITDSVLLGDFLFLDSEAEISGSLTESDILNSGTNKNSTAMDYNEDEDENDDNAEINKLSYDEITNSFETIRHGLQWEENTPEGIFGALQRCEVHYETKPFFKQKTQTKLTDFMSNYKFKDTCGNVCLEFLVIK